MSFTEIYQCDECGHEFHTSWQPDSCDVCDGCSQCCDCVTCSECGEKINSDVMMIDGKCPECCECEEE
jgi:hypothetical protein